MQPILIEFPGWGISRFLRSDDLARLNRALWITAWRARREKLEVSSVYELAGWLFLGGVIGRVPCL